MSQFKKPTPPRRVMPAAVKARELMPGDVALGLAGDQLKTLLGSCVCVILTDPRHTVAAMCHIVHVGRAPAGETHNTAYGVAAMHDMFNRLQSVGIIPNRCHAYVYGGGNMFPGLAQEGHVGNRNGLWVQKYLLEHGIDVVDVALGGNGYRRVAWTVGQGEPVVEMVSVEEA